MLVNISDFFPESELLLVQSLSVSKSLWPHGLYHARLPWSLLKIHVHWVNDAIQPYHCLLPPPPPTLNLSQHQGLFQWVSSSIRWTKFWNFSFSISPSNEYSGLISFRIGLFLLLAVQTLKSLLQHHSLKASILWRSAFSVVQLSHLYMTTGKVIA